MYIILEIFALISVEPFKLATIENPQTNVYGEQRITAQRHSVALSFLVYFNMIEE
jgi:hypothetical protein